MIADCNIDDASELDVLLLAESIGDFYPDAKWQRCNVYFYRNVFSVVPRGRVKKVAMMLKAMVKFQNR